MAKEDKENLVSNSLKQTRSKFGITGNTDVQENKVNTNNKDNKRKQGIQRKKRTFPIELGLLETLERASYWDRKDQNKIVEEALRLFFNGKGYKAKPEE